MSGVSNRLKTRLGFFSRDLRTHKLFRGSWVQAAEREKEEFRVHTREQGIAAACRYISSFVQHRSGTRVVFGTAEIALLSAFAARRDVFVFTGMGRLLQRGGTRARLMLSFLRATDRGQRVVVLNEDDRLLLEPLYGERISVMPGEGYRFDRDPAPRHPSDRLRLAYAGRLLRSKGVDDLIRACRRLNVDLLLMGDVDFGNSDAIDTAWLTQQIADTGGRIRHLGFVDNVRERLADADLYVSLSEREGLPFGVLDGLNAGCGLLLSDVPGHREFAGLPGVTFIPADRRQLEERIADMIANPDAYLSFDAQARLAVCEQKYGFETVVSQIRAILFDRRSAPDSGASAS